ncbi:hypothetical protein POTOM_021264 [Populus tomentosa]|uniref:DOC domain-containing protein n=1 Tax=Populus tomentosa TaxID=118781 RepID=A0A8X8A3N5_POPTO|nr:hypothetical protein POTOM_021264 [Populus tomentosa]
MATESSEGEEEGKITGGNKHLVIEDDLREMGKKAAWSVSSCKPGNGISSLRDDNLDTYWQLTNIPFWLSVYLIKSDGAQPHLVNIQFQKKVKLQLVVLYVDFKLDESYTPSKISIRAGDGFHNLKEIKTMELVKPTGWVYLSLSGNDPRETFVNTFMLQIAVLSNHLNGRDTHEPFSASAFSIYFKRVHYVLLCEMRNMTLPTKEKNCETVSRGEAKHVAESSQTIEE